MQNNLKVNCDFNSFKKAISGEMKKKQNKKPKVSVIIPFFRHMECAKSSNFPYFEYAEPIKSCVESVRNQTYKNKEIIFADTRSPKGSGVVRNHALKRAKGDIVFFICSDAILVGKNAISNLVKTFEKTGADVVVGSAKASKKMRPFIYLLNLEYEKRTCDMGEKFTNIGATTYLAIKKDVLKKIGGIPINSPVVKTNNPFFNSGFLDWDLAILLKNYKYFHTNKLKVYHHYQTDFWSYFKKQFWQGWYRIGFGKKFGKFSEGYANWRVMFQTPLWFLTFLWIILSVIGFRLWPFFLYLNLTLIFFWHLPDVLKYFKQEKTLKAFLILPISFIRSFVWLLGAVRGIWDFYIRR